MDSAKLKQGLIGGLAAVAAMTMLMLIAPMMGMPDMNMGKMLGGVMGVSAIIGWVAHLMIGIVWAMVYVFLVRDKLSFSPAVNGMLFSLIPWLLMQLMAMPMMGMGVFSSASPVMFQMIVGTLIGHLVYGLVLGVVARQK